MTYHFGMQMCRACFISLLLSLSACSSTVVSRSSLQSEILQREVDYAVFLPSDYESAVEKGQRFPVVYWLHCLGCDLDNYTHSGYCAPLDSVIETQRFIIAAPFDGREWGWWLDSPVDSLSQWSSFLVEEFKPAIDSMYQTVQSRENTGVVGHSMGGFGALHNAIEHPDVFGVAFSIKGGLDPKLPINENWPSDFGFRGLLGTEDTSQWDSVNVLKNAEKLKSADVTLGFYAGERDGWFYEENQRLHRKLDSLEVDHLYWSNNELHGRIPVESMTRIVQFFDSAFTYTSASSLRMPEETSITGMKKAEPKGRQMRVRVDGRRVGGVRHEPREVGAEVLHLDIAPSEVQSRGAN